MEKIKIIREKKGVTNYTFVVDSLSPVKSDIHADESDSDSSEKINKGRREFELRDDAARQLDKMKHKSKIFGGHSMQGHSPVYE